MKTRFILIRHGESVANYERIYELSKLNRNIENSLNTTDSVKAKQTLRDLQEEIHAL